MTKFEFCQHFIYLKGRPISFADRPYLRAPYDSKARRLVIRAGRQVEKSTFLGNQGGGNHLIIIGIIGHDPSCLQRLNYLGFFQEPSKSVAEVTASDGTLEDVLILLLEGWTDDSLRFPP
jgi:hypothetical protein